MYALLKCNAFPIQNGGWRKDRKILFVCLGNICRSPSAEAILKHLLEKRGNSADWEIDSAGILDLHNGLRSDSRGFKVLKKHTPSSTRNMELRIHTEPTWARQVHEDDFRHFDVIIRVVTRYIFSPLIPIFSSKFWSLIPKCSKIWSLIQRKFYDPIERCDQVMFPRRRFSFISNN